MNFDAKDRLDRAERELERLKAQIRGFPVRLADAGRGGGGTSSPRGGGVTVLLERDIDPATTNLERIEGDINSGGTGLVMDDSDHGIEVDDEFDVRWDGGVRTGVTASAVSGPNITCSGGSGSALEADAPCWISSMERVPPGDPVFRVTPHEFIAKKLIREDGKDILKRASDATGTLVARDSDEVGTVHVPGSHDLLDGEEGVFVWWSGTSGLRRSKVEFKPASSGTLSTRTDDTNGTATVAEDHEITTGAVADVTWSGGSRTGVTVGSVSGTSVPFSGGSGDNLPAEDASITVDPSKYIRLSGEDDHGDVLPSTSTAIVLTHYQVVRACHRFVDDFTITPNRFEITALPRDDAGIYWFGFAGCESIPRFLIPPLEPLEEE